MVKVLDLVEKMNVVVSMVGVERQMTIVVKDVSLNLENVIQKLTIIRFLKMEDVVKVLEFVRKMNVVVNMVGVGKQINIAK